MYGSRSSVTLSFYSTTSQHALLLCTYLYNNAVKIIKKKRNYPRFRRYQKHIVYARGEIDAAYIICAARASANRN